MNILARKLNLIEEFLHINDENVISQLEKICNEEKVNAFHNSLKPMTNEEFYSMIDQSKKDIAGGNVISHHELLKKVTTWK